MKSCSNRFDLSPAKAKKTSNHLHLSLAKVEETSSHLDLSLAKVDKICELYRFIARKKHRNVFRFTKFL